jgi:dihydroceramidase
MPFNIVQNLYPNDPLNDHGNWGPVTSTLDWCEENYRMSWYVAEFWNAVSNMNYILLALLGLWSCYNVGSEKRDYFAYLGLCCVGIGSFLFHMTLLYPMQLCDELPMIYAGAFLVFNYLNIFPSAIYARLSGIILLLYATIVTLVYETTRIPEFFQVSYAFLAILSAILPAIQAQHFLKLNDLELKEKFSSIFRKCAGAYLVGFILWLVDNTQCDYLRIYRSSLPAPLKHFTQLHAWWHLLTGYGAFGAVGIAQYLRLLALGRKDVKLGIFLIYPVVVMKAKNK